MEDVIGREQLLDPGQLECLKAVWFPAFRKRICTLISVNVSFYIVFQTPQMKMVSSAKLDSSLPLQFQTLTCYIMQRQTSCPICENTRFCKTQ